MKVLLANPPTYLGKGTFNRPIRFPTYSYATPVLHPPLLLAYAAAYLRSRGHDVKLVDAQADAISVSDFIQQVRQSQPDYVVFETSTPSLKNDIQVAQEIKDLVRCRVVFVGSHVSALPVESMEGNGLDAVVVGEYELSLAEYVERGGEATQGVCYRDGGRVVLNPPREYLEGLDILPFPARDLLPNYKYFDPILKNPFTFVLGGRGCSYKCTFCNWPQIMTGRRYRRRSPRNIVDELELIEQQYHFKSFLFNDDTFTVHKEFAMEVCHEIMGRGIKLPWGCYSRADNTDAELLGKLKDAGCYLLKVGVESGDQGILNNVRKGYRLEAVEKGIRLMKEMGFHVHATFVFGLPGETQETIDHTIEFAKKLCPTTVQFSTAVPYPRTELYRYLQEKGLLLTEDWDNWVPLYPIFGYPHLPAQAITQAVKKAYRRYYFRPAYFKVGLQQLLTRPVTVAQNVRKLVRLSF